MKEINLSKYKQPHPDQLKFVAVRIDRIAGRELTLLGSGVLFKMGGDYYVATAAHCVTDDTNNVQIPLSELRVSLAAMFPNEHYSVVELADYQPDDAVDFALLKICFNPRESPQFDYATQIRFVREDVNAPGIAAYGYCNNYSGGLKLELSCLSTDNRYKITDGISASGAKLRDIHGLSGSGVFAVYGDAIYSMGFIKGYPESGNLVDEVFIRRIPSLPDASALRDNILDFDGVKNEVYGDNSPQIDYYKAWNELRNSLPDSGAVQQSLAPLIERIRACKLTYPWPKGTAVQESVVRMLLYGRGRKDETSAHWSDEEYEVLALALEDLGQWPALYGTSIPGGDKLIKNPKFVSLLQKAATITGNTELEATTPDTSTDSGTYLLIMRAAYRFDFKQMRALVESWNPSDPHWTAKKIMLDHLWQNYQYRDANKELLDSEALNLEEKFVAAVIYNQTLNPLDRQETLPYNRFHVAGLNTPGEVIDGIVSNIGRQKADVRPYGVVTVSMFDSGDTESFPAALRLVRYLLDTGLFPTSGWRNVVSTDKWLKVFLRLFNQIPGAVLFYTTLYMDEKLARRCGQEIAFSNADNSDELRKVVLPACLSAIVNPNTPRVAIPSLYDIAREILPAVNESVWFDDFMTVVRNPEMFGSIDFASVTSRDWAYRWLETAACELHVPEHVAIFLNWIKKPFKKNPELFAYIVAQIPFSREIVNYPEVSAAIALIFNDYELEVVHSIMQGLNFRGLLTHEQKKLAEAKAAADGLQFAVNDCDAMRLLSHLLDSTENVDALKGMILGCDMWACGIDGRTYSHTDHCHLESLAPKLRWSDEELAAVGRNMLLNIEKIESLSGSSFGGEALVFGTRRLLGEMLVFLTKNKSRNVSELNEAQRRVEALLACHTGGADLYTMLASEKYDDLSSALELLMTEINSCGVEANRESLGMIIYRATLCPASFAGPIAGMVAELVKMHGSEMLRLFGPQMRLMVDALKRASYDALNCNILYLRRDIASIEHLLNQ